MQLKNLVTWKKLMKVTPFETYQSYLSMKNHFTNRKYDFFRYGGKSSATVLLSIREKISIGLRKHQESILMMKLLIFY